MSQIAVDSVDNIRTVASLGLEDTFHALYREETRKPYRYITLTPSHPHTLTSTPSPTHPHLLTYTPSPTHPHTLTYTPSHPHTLTSTPSPTHPHLLTYTPSPTHPHTLTYTPSHPHLHTLTYTPSHPHLHTLTYTHTQTWNFQFLVVRSNLRLLAVNHILHVRRHLPLRRPASHPLREQYRSRDLRGCLPSVHRSDLWGHLHRTGWSVCS